MNIATLSASAEPGPSAAPLPHLDHRPGRMTVLLFVSLLMGGAVYTAMSLSHDVQASGWQATTYLPFLLLGIALLIALGFEFVNGFHDTANAVATVIYTHSLRPSNLALAWVLALPMAMLLSGSLYWLLNKLFQ